MAEQKKKAEVHRDSRCVSSQVCFLLFTKTNTLFRHIHVAELEKRLEWIRTNWDSRHVASRAPGMFFIIFIYYTK